MLDLRQLGCDPKNNHYRSGKVGLLATRGEKGSACGFLEVALSLVLVPFHLADQQWLLRV